MQLTPIRGQLTRRSRIRKPRDGGLASTSSRCSSPSSCLAASSGQYTSRSTAGRPAPRSTRGVLRSESSFAPGRRGDRAAACSPSPRRAIPPSKTRPGAAADQVRTASTVSVDADGGATGRAGSATARLLPGDVGGHDQRRDLAGRPNRGGDRLGRVAAQLRRRFATCAPSVETLRATVSMSDCSCASYCVW